MIVLTRAQLLRRFVLGVLVGIFVHAAVAHALKPVEVIDVRMEVGCKLPTLEGQATLFLVVDGKLRCYRWY